MYVRALKMVILPGSQWLKLNGALECEFGSKVCDAMDTVYKGHGSRVSLSDSSPPPDIRSIQSGYFDLVYSKLAQLLSKIASDMNPVQVSDC